MQGLMHRLADLDAGAASSVRVIDYFDALIRHRADVPAAVRAAAALGECTVGVSLVRDGGAPVDLRCGPGGGWITAAVGEPRVAERLAGDGLTGLVWIERDGRPHPLDALLVERLALTVTAIASRTGRPAPTSATRSAELLFAADREAAESCCAALRLDPRTPVRVASATGVRTSLVEVLPGEPAAGRSTEIVREDERLLVCAQDTGVPPGPVPRGVRIGLSFAVAARDVRDHVRTARFARANATADTPAVVADELGALVLMSPEPVADLCAIPDLRALRTMPSRRCQELVRTLSAYLDGGSLRAAATRLNLHHTSVSQRLAKLSEHLGFPVDEARYRARAAALIIAARTRPDLAHTPAPSA
ncbi:helix-turn-helix domain-containing protein [Saccharopolyspora sp. MS10]|uniref:helix-turn-helix domain-containing protein n=1 Tax=Saccharopolyspora sp. MS10 TaxID=3385973 RepID=UPI0039A2E9C6